MKHATRLALLLTAAAALSSSPQTARAIVAGDPNPPTGSNGLPLYPADSPSNPYNPVTHTGRLDQLGLASPFSGVGTIDEGTGTLIDSTHVLTAAHLFDRSGTNPAGIAFTLTNGTITQSFAASAIAIDPLYRGVGNDDVGDIAVVTLSAPVPAIYQTYRLSTAALTSGTTVTLVGYGQSGNGITGYDGSPSARRVGENNADAFLLPGGDTIDTTYQPGYQTYLYDFDSPDGSAPNQIGGGSLGNDVETTIGVGDSGGPAFISVNGQYQIAAINNFRFQFGTKPNLGPFYPFFGSGGGGAIVSGYSDFLAPYLPAPAPEPAAWMPFVLGGAMLMGIGLRARKTAPRSQV